MEQRKTCSTCRQDLLLADFNREATGTFGKQARCRGCQRKAGQKWREKNREQSRRHAREWNAANPQAAIEHHYKRRYGITWAQYQSMLEDQDGKCAICLGSCSTGKRLSVDHDHLTGAVRSLLCMNCNSGLGQFRDDEQLLVAALEYVRAHRHHIAV